MEQKNNNDSNLLDKLLIYWEPKNVVKMNQKVNRTDFWLIYFVNIVITSFLSLFINLDKLVSITTIVFFVLNIILGTSYLIKRANSANIKKIIPILFYGLSSIVSYLLIMPIMIEVEKSGIYKLIEEKASPEQIKALLSTLSTQNLEYFNYGVIMILIAIITYTVIGTIKDK